MTAAITTIGQAEATIRAALRPLSIAHERSLLVRLLIDGMAWNRARIIRAAVRAEVYQAIDDLEEWANEAEIIAECAAIEQDAAEAAALDFAATLADREYDNTENRE